MNLSNLKPAKGSTSNRKRIGRGNASGQGRTAGKGHKGYKSTTGTKAKLHFEGGQTPMARRLPKRGMGTGKFNHLLSLKKPVQTINLSILNRIESKDINKKTLYKLGLINNLKFSVKILGNGIIEKPLNVKVEYFSKVAKQKIEEAGGKIEVI